MRAVIIERNKLVSKRIARGFLAAGWDCVIADEPQAAVPLLAGADLLGADVFDGDAVLELCRQAPSARPLLWTAEPLRRALRYLAEHPRLDHVLGRRDFDSAPRPGELAVVLRQLAGAAPPPLASTLAWGATVQEWAVGSPAERDQAVAEAQAVIARLGVPRRMAEMIGELGHELLMNAMYDAPVDATGRALYAADRKADIRLAGADRPTLRLGTDGTVAALQVSDRFGRLTRDHIVGGLTRGLAAGEMDRSHGGAGLGLLVCHNASTSLAFELAPSQRTTVTASFELDLNLREFRTTPRSLLVHRAPPA